MMTGQINKMLKPVNKIFFIYFCLKCKTTLHITEQATHAEKRSEKCNLQLCDNILSICINCTSIFLLQSVFKPFSSIVHSLHFLAAVLVWNYKKFFKDRHNFHVWTSPYTNLHAHIQLCLMMHQHKHILQNHNIGLLCLTYCSRVKH